jgi:hypothetical protein
MAARPDLHGQEDVPASHVTYRTEDDEPRPEPTMMQKLKERVSDYENHLKGKESSYKEDPHPELAYIQPAEATDLQEGEQHGGVPKAALGKNEIAESVPKARVHEKEYTGEGADEPTTMEKMKKKFWDAENHLKGKESSAVEDPHPELSYITPMPEQKKEGLLSKIEQKFQGHGDDKAPKGTASNELGTGYEEDAEDKINPAVVPNYDAGVKAQP